MSATSAAALSAVFKAYDVRGTVPDQLDDDLARAVGSAFVEVTGASSTGVVVGHDMRPSSPGMARAFAEGAAAAGADVTMIGLASTDQLYFASGSLGLPGRDVHGEPQPGAVQRHQDVPRARRAAGHGHRPERRTRPRGGGRPPWWASGPAASSSGTCSRTTRPTCSGSRRSPAGASRSPSTPATGWPGTPRPRSSTGSTSTSSRSTSSSTAPSPTTRPTRSSPPTCADLQALVRESGADIGLAFDGDADRCFLVDERGELVNPSVVTAPDRLPRARPGPRQPP